MSETESKTGTTTAAAWLAPLVVVLLGLVLYVPHLGTSGLWDPWEPRYAQTAREMSERGDFLVPHYRHGPRLNKAPLTYWLIAGSHALGGVNETAARMPSMLLALACAAALAAALAAWGRWIEGLLAGAALLTMPQWYLLGRFATPDMPLAACLGGVLALALWQSSRGAGRRPLPLLGAALLVAAAGMADWPRGLLLPLWGVLGWGALRWSWKGPVALALVAATYHAGQLAQSVPLNLMSFVLALVLAAVVLRLRVGVSVPVILAGVGLIAVLVAPWFVVVSGMEPDSWSLYRYKYAFNLGESVGQHEGPYAAVVRTVAAGGLPWSALAVVGLLAGLLRRRDRAAGILAGAAIGSLLFFTLSAAQMGHFYVVIQPAVAGLAAIGAVALVRRVDWRVALALAAFVAVGAWAWDRPSRILDAATVKSNLFGVELETVVLGVMLSWLLALLAAGIRGRESWTLVAVLPAAVLVAKLGWSVVPTLEPKKTLKAVWQTCVEHREVDEPVGLWGPSRQSIYYYSNASIVRLEEYERVKAFLSGPGTKILIGTTEAIDRPLKDDAVRGEWKFLDPHIHPIYRVARFTPAETAD